jgi:citrate lyase beta subunit
MLLLCIFDADGIRALHDVDTTTNTIQRIRQLMEPWVKLDLTIAANVRRLDELMLSKCVQGSRGIDAADSTG